MLNEIEESVDERRSALLARDVEGGREIMGRIQRETKRVGVERESEVFKFIYYCFNLLYIILKLLFLKFN